MNYKKSKRADADVEQITVYSFENFGERRTREYLAGLEATLEDLAHNPNLGKEYKHSKKDICYRYHQYMSHVIYYRNRQFDIFIVRVLHKRMLPMKHL